MLEYGRHWWNMVVSGGIWPALGEYGGFCCNMVECGQIWRNMADYGVIWQTLGGM